MSQMNTNLGKAKDGLFRRTGAALIAFTVATSGLLIVATPASAVPVLTVPMGTLTNFSALANTTITDTGSTSTFADGVAVAPGTAITTIGDGQVHSGGIHRNDAVAQQAQTDLTVAYEYAKAQTGAAIGAELGTQTLHPGVHTAGATALGLTGTLTLDGDGNKNSVFIIQTLGAFTAAASALVVLTDSAQECNVFFQVQGAVTLGAGAVFRGNILSEGAVTVGADADFHGRALTTLGDMTLSGNEFFESTCAGEVGVTVGPISGPTTEAATTSTFTVVLTSEPTAQVTIGVSSTDTTEGTVSTGLLTFTTTNWATAQTVNVTGVNDFLDDGDVIYSIALATASGGDYTGIDPAEVSVTNTDNDTVGVTVGPISGPTTEAATTSTFTVVLTSEPSATVTIGVSSSDTTEGTVSTGLLTFTTTNWATAQTVNVTGVNDFLDDGDVIYSIALATASGGDYTGIDPADVSVTNTDNDTVGVTVGAISGPTTEAGGAATFTVVLDSQPSATVTIGVSSSDTTEGTVSTGLLSFTTTSWATAQTVTVTGMNDAMSDGNVAYSVTLDPAGGGDYSGFDPADVSMTNTDNDTTTTASGDAGGGVAPAATGLIDTSNACPDSIASSGFGDLAGFDETTVHAINCIFAYGISNGTTDLTFTPSGTVPRWQMALFLVRHLHANGVLPPTAIAQEFNDIAGFDQETQDAINQLAQLGITLGTGVGTFSPNSPISRWEMALFLVRSDAVVGTSRPTPTPAGFTDMTSMSTETTNAVDQLVALGIAEGTSATTYEPENPVLRWQMALFLTRVLAVDGIIPN